MLMASLKLNAVNKYITICLNTHTYTQLPTVMNLYNYTLRCYSRDTYIENLHGYIYITNAQALYLMLG